MQKALLAVLAVAVVVAFVSCASPGGAAMMKCEGCKMECPKDKMCSMDQKCAMCDKCPGKCGGCGKDMKAMDLSKCHKMCPACEKCPK